MTESATLYDVVVIGGGPAGYPAAIRARQLGLSVLCIDDWRNRDGTPALGGTCLNAGCIPSKALLESTELAHRAREEFARHGIKFEGLSIDLAAMQARRAGIVRTMTGGIAALFRASGVVTQHGNAQLLASGQVRVTTPEGQSSEVQARHVILAAGSIPTPLPALPVDHVRILDSWDALELDAVPTRLCVVGAGVIGLELGSVWRRLGAEVVLLEAMDTFVPAVDEQLAREATRQFARQGLQINLGAMVLQAQSSDTGVEIRYRNSSGEQTLQVDKVIVAAGRRPRTEGLLAEGCGVRTDARGFIVVDDNCHTEAANVWAVGDCVRGPMLAHKGRDEGIAVAERIAGGHPHVSYDTIPSVIYTAPEIAWVGRNEQQLKAAGVQYKSGVFPFAASGRARAMEASSGMAKVLADAATDRILGAHIIGPMAGELIAEAVLAMEFHGSAEDLQRTIHAHPTLSEALHEAALAVDRRAIDSINR